MRVWVLTLFWSPPGSTCLLLCLSAAWLLVLMSAPRILFFGGLLFAGSPLAAGCVYLRGLFRLHVFCEICQVTKMRLNFMMSSTVQPDVTVGREPRCCMGQLHVLSFKVYYEAAETLTVTSSWRCTCVPHRVVSVLLFRGAHSSRCRHRRFLLTPHEPDGASE